MTKNGLLRLSGLIGLCAKAGKISSGEFGTERSIRSGKAKLCIIACDASDNSRKNIEKLCSMHGVRLCEIDTDKDTLGHWIGRGSRTAVTVLDQGFADNVSRLIEGGKASER